MADGEGRRAGETELHGGALLGSLPYPQWLRQTRDNADPKTVRADWVVSDTRFVLRPSDGRVVGMADIRHSLNEFLAAYGGHIGCGVRPSERGRGYGTAILRLALARAGALGLPRVMLACYRDNAASRRMILTCGGRKQREFTHTDGKTVEVFWIEL